MSCVADDFPRLEIDVSRDISHEASESKQVPVEPLDVCLITVECRNVNTARFGVEFKTPMTETWEAHD